MTTTLAPRATTTKRPARYPIARAWVAAHAEQEARTQRARGTVLTPMPEGNTQAQHSAQRTTAPVEAHVYASPTVGIMATLDAILSTLRAEHADIPAAIAITLASGHGKSHGHFAPGAWQDTQGEHSGAARHELNMATESFARGPQATLTTLIHEAVHAAHEAQGVKGTSRGGRYHNERFNATATEWGLLTAKTDKFGWTTTGLTPWALTHYAPQIAALETALSTYRKPVDKKVSKPKTTIRVACSCEFPVTVPVKWWEDYGVDYMVCGMCEEGFQPVES